MPGEDTVHRLCEAFRALGDPTRTRILLALEQAEMCVCDLAALLRLTSPAVSHQLRLLRGLGLVRYRREGKLAYYSLDDDHIMALIRMGREHIEE
jgi:DNA-binding transcriptional ArsR family regulator